MFYSGVVQSTTPYQTEFPMSHICKFCPWRHLAYYMLFHRQLTTNAADAAIKIWYGFYMYLDTVHTGCLHCHNK